MPNFLWIQQLLTKEGLDAYCQHVVKTVKHYHIRSRSLKVPDRYKLATLAASFITSSALRFSGMHLHLEYAANIVPLSYVTVTNHFPGAPTKQINSGNEFYMMQVSFARSTSNIPQVFYH